MLNPCKPCVCPSAPCEQCSFGYKSTMNKHEMMKKLIEAVNNGEKPNGYICAERYMKFHSDWNEHMQRDELLNAQSVRKCLVDSVKDPANVKEYHGLITTEVISEEKAREGFRHFPYEKRYLEEPGKPIHTTNPVIKD